MTPEEAKRILIQYSDDCADMPDHEDMVEACKVAIKVLEQQLCEDKQDCEHCIHTYGTLGCCNMVNNKWIYDCDFGREQYEKEHA